jgi:hypothetical protein
MPNSDHHKSRYPVLAIASTCYKGAGWLMIPFFLVQSWTVIKNFGAKEAIGAVLITALYCAIAFISFFAIAELIKLFVDIEDNTRRQADKPDQL